jgi:hypothetical protein
LATGVFSMQPPHVVHGATFGPEALKVLGQAFDEAWASIADRFGDEPNRVAAARLQLAEILLTIASEESCDPEALKARALKMTNQQMYP